MTGVNATSQDEDFFDLLADADEALASGTTAEPSWTHGETPDWDLRLEKGLGCLRQLQQLRPVRLDQARQLGPFSIRRELGRGGFGVVFLADDSRLGRPIALKVPRADFLADEKLRNRFQIEARAAARLDHPNIVAVYEAGDIGPVAYIASAYCPGLNLAQWLRQTNAPVPWRAAVELVATLADAVEYAHRQGVLHRDLKPANVILQGAEPNQSHVDDLQSVIPKLADFGLARLIDSDSTQSRGVLGTPSYMPPEQAAGRAADIGPRSDVYSLGAILYELWTGRPPFQGESPLDVIQQVQWQEPLSPARLRPGMPRDLETICCKCLEKEPRHRYATAAALARDLRHCLAGEPIQARPIGAHERVWRWCRRNPSLASLVTAIAFFLPAALVALSALYWHADYEAKRADALATKNAIERDKAVANYQRARAAVRRLSQLGNEISDRPGLDRAQAAVYEEVLQHCLTFLTESRDDPTVRLDTSRAWRQVGRVRLDFGKAPDAVTAFEHEAALLDDLLREDPVRRDLRMDRARNELWRGHSLRRSDRPAPAAGAYRGAIRRCEELAADAPPGDVSPVILANAWLNLGSMLMLDHLPDADEALNHALAVQNRIQDQFKEQRFFLYDFALTLGSRAVIRNRQGRQTEAEESIRQSMAVCQSLLKKWPHDPNGTFYLARAQCNLGEILQSTGRLTEAEKACVDGRDSFVKLTADYPGVVDYRSYLAATYNQLAHILEKQYRLNDSLASLQQAIIVQKRLAGDFPDRKDVREYLGVLDCRLGRIFARLDQTAKCLAECQNALSHTPDDPIATNLLAWTLALCPEPELRNPPEALRLAELATRAAPNDGDCWNTLGAARYVMGEFHLALEALARAEACRPRAEVDDFLLISLCHAKLGDTNQSSAYFKKAESLFENHRPKDPYTIRLRAEAAACQPKKD